MNLFDLEHQYQLYLQRVGLSEAQMNAQQRIETRRAFMGACGQMLHLLTDGLDGMSEEEAMPELSRLFEQVDSFWKAEAAKELCRSGADPEAVRKFMGIFND